MPFRNLFALVFPVTFTLRPFLAKPGYSTEDVEKMYAAWEALGTVITGLHSASRNAWLPSLSGTQWSSPVRILRNEWWMASLKASLLACDWMARPTFLAFARWRCQDWTHS